MSMHCSMAKPVGPISALPSSGLCLLQEWNDLSDQEALDTFSFDVRWRYALDVSDEDYLSAVPSLSSAGDWPPRTPR